MSRPVLLTITGIPDGGEPIKIVVRGSLLYKNDSCYIFYTLVDEDGHRQKNRMTIREDGSMAELRKDSGSASCLRFVPGREEQGRYATPAGYLDLSVRTGSLAFERKEDSPEDGSLRLHLKYSLYAQGSHMSDHELILTASYGPDLSNA